MAVTALPEFTPEMLGALTEAERATVRALALEYHATKTGKLRRPLSFVEFVNRVTNNRYNWYRFAVVLAGVLQKVADGQLTRVIITAPPRHGKSEPVSRLFPAYYLYRFPERWVGLASYGAQLAATLARSARQNYLTAVGSLSTEAKAVNFWQTGEGGGMWAAGVGGSLLGLGMHLGLIDDPLKNYEEAASLVVRETQREWYSSTFYTRLEPGGAIVIIMQRWPGDDLVGWLLEEERANAENPDALEHWHIVHFEAIKESAEEIEADEKALGTSRFPASCTVEPDWRSPGQPLAPGRYPLERLLRTKQIIGNFFWNALYQQRPRAREGLMFPPDKLTRVKDFDRTGIRLVRFWDFGALDEAGDYTVGFLLARNAFGQYCIMDVKRGQWATFPRNQIIRATAEQDFDDWGDAVQTWGEQEPGSSGKDAARAFVKLLEGYSVHILPQTGDKVKRAEGMSAAWQAGNIAALAAEWNAVVRREFADFPNGSHDDIPDAGSSAFNLLARKTGRGRVQSPGSMVISG
jgi:predicted phage terminase large subunit-like protein